MLIGHCEQNILPCFEGYLNNFNLRYRHSSLCDSKVSVISDGGSEETVEGGDGGAEVLVPVGGGDDGHLAALAEHRGRVRVLGGEGDQLRQQEHVLGSGQQSSHRCTLFAYIWRWGLLVPAFSFSLPVRL